MKFTPEYLQGIAQETVERRTKDSFDILAAYLWGSLVTKQDPLLGDTTDIDIVFIHNGPPEERREIQRLTEQIHLDITHHAQKLYLDGKALRVDPWMGPSLYNAKALHDPQHFVNYTLSGVRAMFHRPDYVIKRVRPLVKEARRQWLELQTPPIEDSRKNVSHYLDILRSAANAVALLNGDILTERRFLSSFAEQTQTLERPELYAGLLGLLGSSQVEVDTIQDWVSAWERDFDSIPDEQRPAKLHRHRRAYYLQAFKAHLESEQPKDVLWPLLRTWCQAATANPTNWQETCYSLELMGPGFSDRLQGLDLYLEQIEELTETWAREHGA
jgi:hypothetical protein